jgi:16S rRNA (cytidine1402-2'-O)-methyltransferase
MLGVRQASLGREMAQENHEAAPYGPAAAQSSGVALPAAKGPAPGHGLGTLTVAAAPIGQPADASTRLADALAATPVIAAEDTRRLRRLAAALGVRLTGRVLSYYDDVEARRAPELLEELKAGRDVLLVTDAGMPGVSDPGYRLIAGAATAGIRVTVLPGPSAVTTALVISGLPCDRFAFEGFPPRRAGERARRFADLAAEPRTLVFFESPRRLGATLAELSAAFGGDRRAAVCRELTKIHEEVIRGTLASLAADLAGGVLGEVTLVIDGAQRTPGPISTEHADAAVAVREASGEPRKDAIAAVARELGVPRRQVYDAVVAGGRPARGQPTTGAGPAGGQP